MTNTYPLVSTEWLANNLDLDQICILDATWHMPNANRDAKSEYNNCHIKGAQFFDIDAISDAQTLLPHMVPSSEDFAQSIGALGINNNTKIIVYDTYGIFTAPRVWWNFRYMGHDNVYVLDGGLKKWLAEGRKTSNETALIEQSNFVARSKPELIKDFDQVKSFIDTGACQIIDARGAARFSGNEAEPRAGLKSGHIKGSKNLPFAKLINENGTMKTPDEIGLLFTNSGVDLSVPIVTTCGSGITACILALALECINVKNVPVYDGSWSEWGAREGALIESDKL